MLVTWCRGGALTEPSVIAGTLQVKTRLPATTLGMETENFFSPFACAAMFADVRACIFVKAVNGAIGHLLSLLNTGCLAVAPFLHSMGHDIRGDALPGGNLHLPCAGDVALLGICAGDCPWVAGAIALV